jgi:uncharacterized protein
MQYRVLGRTGLNVSVVGFGGAPSGLRNYLGKWEPESDEASRLVESAINHAVERGINYFDTAPGYGAGASESMFGRALKQHRDRIVLATKLTGDDESQLRRSAEQSLVRLRTHHVDVLQYHGGYYTDADVDRFLKPGGVIDGLKAIRRDGLTRFIGFTSEGANGATSRFVATGEFDVMQICYNLIYQHPYDPSRKAGALYEAEAQQMGIVTMRPLTSGIFQHWANLLDPTLEQRVDLPRALLGFVLSNPLVDVAIVGMRSPARVDANVAIADDPAARLDLNAMHERYVQG